MKKHGHVFSNIFCDILSPIVTEAITIVVLAPILHLQLSTYTTGPEAGVVVGLCIVGGILSLT
jgi:hypothetical protein